MELVGVADTRPRWPRRCCVALIPYVSRCAEGGAGLADRPSPCALGGRLAGAPPLRRQAWGGRLGCANGGAEVLEQADL